MAKIAYKDINFRPATLAIIEQADAICQQYAADGYSLTARQLFYQFVARGLIVNRPSEYKRLCSIVDDARYAGLIDWDHIVDRTRQMRELPHWGDGADEGKDAAHTFIRSVLPQFRTRKWSTQPVRIEVWIEKDALLDVIARPANALDVPYFACRGYNSTSNAHEAAERIEGYLDEDTCERVVILHLGDHDPEGIDMSRDIEARFRTFLEGDGYDPDLLEVRRIALNMDQVLAYNPPPNTAKESSSRFTGYVAKYGKTCWELDALDPPTLDALIRTEVEAERDEDLWGEAVARETEGKRLLTSARDRWSEVVDLLSEEGAA